MNQGATAPQISSGSSAPFSWWIRYRNTPANAPKRTTDWDHHCQRGSSFRRCIGRVLPPYSIIAGNCSAITAADQNQASTSTSYTVAVNPPVTLSPTALPAGLVGAAYSQTITASGGSGDRTLTYTVSGTVPTGLALTPASPATNTLAISGTPTAAGSFSIHVSASDALNAPPATRDYTVTVNDVPAVNRPPVLDAIGAKAVSEGNLLTFTA